MEISQRPLRYARLGGSAPRVAAYVLVALLSAAGIASIARGHRTVNETFVRSGRSFDLAAAALATEFARAYLTYQVAHPERRAEALARFTNNVLDAEAGVTAEGSQTVSWAEPAQEQALKPGEEIVTVAAQTDRASTAIYLAVTVARSSNGALAVAGDPAFVGPPEVDNEYAAPTQQPVTDTGLTAVVTRVVSNYLSDNPQDLQADLITGSKVTLPTIAMSVEHVTNVTWAAAPGLVEVDVTARAHAGATFALTYFIAVVRRERWYATSISVNPAST
jgi:hypothetical protein